MSDSYDNGYGESRERFERDTAEHEMTILRDDGVYRHVRFTPPDSSFYHYDLVTWPGYLAIVGDCEDYMFRRTTDMFDFFAGERQAEGINPHYWSQKLCGDRGRDISRSYSEDRLRAHVIEWFEQQAGLAAKTGRVPRWEAAQEMRRWRGSRFTRRWRRRQLLGLEGEMPIGRALALSRALEADVLDDFGGEGEGGAHRRLRDFEWFYDGSESWEYHAPGTPSVTISDPWEWDLRDFDGWFLWCCWAIRRGIERYREATTAEAALSA